MLRQTSEGRASYSCSVMSKLDGSVAQTGSTTAELPRIGIRPGRAYRLTAHPLRKNAVTVRPPAPPSQPHHDEYAVMIGRPRPLSLSASRSPGSRKDGSFGPPSSEMATLAQEPGQRRTSAVI